MKAIKQMELPELEGMILRQDIELLEVLQKQIKEQEKKMVMCNCFLVLQD
ncbi:MAG: hypothetical protein AAGA18_10610 [Verrucomicrobiota bacterium]